MQALVADPNNHILLSNRSACYLSVKESELAVADACHAVTIEPLYMKGYYRLANAYQSLKEYDQAMAAVCKGISVDPSCDSLLKLKVQYENLTHRRAQEKIKIEERKKQEKLDKAAMIPCSDCVGECSPDCGMRMDMFIPKPKRKVKGKAKASPSTTASADPATKKTTAAPEKDIYSPTEYVMLCEVNTCVKKISAGEMRSIGGGVLLPGGIADKIQTENGFLDVLFPGCASQALRKTLPKNLRELFTFDNFISSYLTPLLPKISKSAAKVFEAIKEKGEKRGDFMDQPTVAVLEQQIALEALVREVVTLVHNQQRKASAAAVAAAEKSQPLTPPKPPAPTVVDSDTQPAEGTTVVTADSVDEVDCGFEEFNLRALYSSTSLHPATAPTLDSLTGGMEGVCIQDNFFGDEWTELLRDDVMRFSTVEHMTKVVCGKEANTLDCAYSWLDLTDIESKYPALFEVVSSNICDIPNHINSKYMRDVIASVICDDGLCNI